MKLEQRRLCQVDLDCSASPHQLSAFLARPLRPLRGLLDPERLQQAGPDLFDYVSRPYGVAAWTLQPRARLQARWDGEALKITQVACRVDGLGEWQSLLSFGLEARLCAADGDSPSVLVAEALVWAELPAAMALVAGPAVTLGLQQLLDRLEHRCQQGLRRRARGWLQRSAAKVDPGGLIKTQH